MTDNKELAFEINLQWEGSDDIPSFHEVVTITYPSTTKVTYTDLADACKEQVEEACKNALVRQQQIREERRKLEALATDTGLDIQSLCDYYDATTVAELVQEMRKHNTTLIGRVSELLDTRAGHHPTTPPRAG